MARPALIAAILLPLPFAALPLFALLLSGPSSSPLDETAYAPVTVPLHTEVERTRTLAQNSGAMNAHGDDFSFDCPGTRAES